MNFRRENDITGAGWRPVTPAKPIPTRSLPVHVDKHGNQLQRPNWQQAGFPRGLMEETPILHRTVQNFNLGADVDQNGRYNGSGKDAGKNRLINDIAGSYARASSSNESLLCSNNSLANYMAIRNASYMAGENRNLNRGVENAECLTSLYSPINNNCRESNFVAPMLTRENQLTRSSLPSIGNSQPHIPQSYTTYTNRTPDRSANTANSSLIPNFNIQVGSNWGGLSSGTSLLLNKDYCSSSNLLSNGYGLAQTPKYGLPVNYQSTYNLYSATRTEGDATSSVTNTNSLQFAPITPDKGKKPDNNHLSVKLNFPTDSPVQEKDKQKNLTTQMANKTVEYNREELLQNIVDSSSPAISTPIKQSENSDKGSNRGIDLNKAPEEKHPKRKKIRPKVVRESNPRNTSKLTTPRNANDKENPSGKRKYVRRNRLKESATQLTEVESETAEANTRVAANSCRRALNFDLEKSIDDIQGTVVGQDEKHQRIKRGFNLDFCSKTDSTIRTESPMQVGQSNVQQSGTSNHLTSSMNQRLTGYISLPVRPPAAATLAYTEGLQNETLHATATKAGARYADSFQKSSPNLYTPIQRHFLAEGFDQTTFQSKSNCKNHEQTIKLISQGSPQMVSRILPNSDEARGSKRDYCHTMEQTCPCTRIQGSSSSLCRGIFHECHKYSSISGAGILPSKKKIRNGSYANTYSKECVESFEDGRHLAIARDANNVRANGFTPVMNHGKLNSCFQNIDARERPSNGINNFPGDWYNHPQAAGYNSAKQQISPDPRSCTERTGKSHQLREVHHFTSLKSTENLSLLQTVQLPIPSPENRQEKKTCNISMSAQKQITGATLSKFVSSGKEIVLKEQQPPEIRRGRPKKQTFPILMDEITYRLNCMSLSGSNNISSQEQKAIVPFKGERAIVPSNGFESTKKRKPRPKVDLDPETNRTWKLLMGIEGNEDLEGKDKNREKWWEDERNVFRGRADSFIARMHLVQGDRRFSRWKGSVLDSVIGVFLTQNVSDHLSSSAFMSLAARFPIKSTSNREWHRDGTTILVQEPEVCITNLDETIKWHGKISSLPVYCDQSSIIPHESREHPKDSETSSTERITLLEANSQNAEEEVVSSQGSFDSSIIQGSGGIRCYSGFNSEAEDLTSGCKVNKVYRSNLTGLLQMDKGSKLQEFYTHVDGSPLHDEISTHRHNQSEGIVDNQQNPILDTADNLESSSLFTFPTNINKLQKRVPDIPSNDYQLPVTPGHRVMEFLDKFADESIASWPSTAPQSTMTKNASFGSEIIAPLTDQLISEKTSQLESYASTSRRLVHQESISQQGSHSEHNLPLQENQQEKNRSINLQRKSAKEPVKFAEPPAPRQKTDMQHFPNTAKLTEETSNFEVRVYVMNKQAQPQKKLVESISKEQASLKAYKETNGKAKTKKNKGKERNAIDWDSLRKEVRRNGLRKERSKDAMDSLDYEALRRANVKEIADCIKDRGMNNMLAERIKEFLNRLVEEHGSIDLEWLRDVPPEKAKDYLLSIWGLGLKSVECVRLLTLHHLAFPVDTNVGRIAVRLGWVPLQPLPESLQLHLLELYPVLETVQKYLWPRLCKLDQRTLYELHYQMITFGKVFCTKNNPNCNACPMRGECRHFASAFASARLTLPGPEDKSIVSSTAPIATERNPAVVINPVPLTLPESNSFKEAGPKVCHCEPIIEEPATPEQEVTQVSESDIEDSSYEDPNAIPTINLGIEVFRETLQNFMQENNLEIQEGDMSKALVALNRQVASIPMPKLKTVSRLRTEHQVYELSDSHPLLKGMDRREPDDPSPYLLAIWTPGETANSIQPPEGCCNYQEGNKLCSEKTCISCNTRREASSQTIRGTILIPCRTATRGSFPLNGTYFQVNEMFADHETSHNPIDVPRAWIWNLPRRTVFFGTSVSTIFKGLSTEDIQYCFWRGFVCVRGFEQKIRAPRPLCKRLHEPASKLSRKRN